MLDTRRIGDTLSLLECGWWAFPPPPLCGPLLKWFDPQSSNGQVGMTMDLQ